MSLVCVFRELYQFGNLFYFISRPDAKVVEDLLEAERMKTDDFSNEIQKLQTDVQALSEQTQQSQEKEKALAERCKEQVILLPFLKLVLISVIRNGNFNMPMHLLVILERKRRSCCEGFENWKNKCRVMIV